MLCFYSCSRSLINKVIWGNFENIFSEFLAWTTERTWSAWFLFFICVSWAWGFNCFDIFQFFLPFDLFNCISILFWSSHLCDVSFNWKFKWIRFRSIIIATQLFIADGFIWFDYHFWNFVPDLSFCLNCCDYLLICCLNPWINFENSHEMAKVAFLSCF